MPDLQGLRVTFVAGTLGAGGAERQLFYALRALQDAGATAQVLYLHAGPWAAAIHGRGIPVRWVGRRGSRALRAGRILSALRLDRPHVVQSQHFFTNAYAAAAARALGLRDVGAIRSDPRRELRLNGRVGGYVNLRAPRLLAVNSRAGIRQAEAYGVPPSRLHYLPNLVDVDEFRPGTDGHGSPVRIIAVGRLLPEKRLDRFLNILARVRGRARTPVQGIIVGAGPERRRLEELATQLRLPHDAVQFRGFVTGMAVLYRHADILVSTSDEEGTPNVVLEAQAAGVPVVATTAGGTPDVVRHGETGYLAASEDEETLANAVFALSESRDLRKRMGAAAREYILAEHSSARLPALLLDLYQRVLA